MIEFSIKGHCPSKINLIVATKDTPLIKLQDTIINEFSKGYQSRVGIILEYVENALNSLVEEDERYIDSFIKSVDMNKLKEEWSSYWENDPSDLDDYSYCTLLIPDFFYTEIIQKAEENKSLFDTKDNRVEINELILNFTGKRETAPLVWDFNIEEELFNLREDKPVLYEGLDKSGLLDFIRTNLKEQLKDEAPVLLEVSENEKIIRI